MRSRWQPRLLAAALAAACAGPGLVLADTVWLQNGDRLSGKIRLLDAGKLSLETDYGGTITLDWKKVKTLESSEEILVRDEALKDEYLAKLQRAEPGHVIVATSETQQTKPLPELDQVMRPRPFINDAIWKGSIDMGLNHKTASTKTEDYRLDADTELRHGRWRHQGSVDYERKKDNNQLTGDKYALSASSDHFISDKFFWQGRGLYRRNKIEDLSRQAGLGTGPGYQFWDDELGAFSLTGLLGRMNYRYRDGASDEFYAASVRWDYKRYLYSQRLELFTAGEVMRPLDNAADISLDAAAGVRYRMTDWVSWFLTYSRNQVSGGRQSLNEKRVTTGLGLTW
ncbi:Peptide chain release factor RF-3 [plant metagenome]|uniref:Peptide chain release factor RF-3 n=1 Tax=plant metagenome TaxID=1297885 RepID=A0A484RTA7_9ZZZZ